MGQFSVLSKKQSSKKRSDLKEYLDRIKRNIFNWNERNTNNIPSLGTNSIKKNTNVCHETAIVFQCIQIRKQELVKIL